MMITTREWDSVLFITAERLQLTQLYVRLNRVDNSGTRIAEPKLAQIVSLVVHRQHAFFSVYLVRRHTSYARCCSS